MYEEWWGWQVGRLSLRSDDEVEDIEASFLRTLKGDRWWFFCVCKDGPEGNASVGGSCAR